MPNPSTTSQLERDAAKIPVTDPQHQPDQSMHQREIDRSTQVQQEGDEKDSQAEG